MKSVAVLFFLLTTSFVQAEDGELLASAKQRILANADQRIGAIQNLKSCVQGAASKDQLKSCRDNHKTAMKQLREENKGERKAFREELKAKKQHNKTNG